MIDWISAILPLPHRRFVCGGLSVSMDDIGQIEWYTRKFLALEGSHSSTIQVRSCLYPDRISISNGPAARDQAKMEADMFRDFGEYPCIYVSGNPSKFLQGHNLFGSDDLVGLVCLLYERIVMALKIEPTPYAWDLVERGVYTLSRVDATAMLPMKSQSDVSAFLMAATPVVRGKHQGTSAYGGETIYIGQRSRRITTKLYNKWLELAKHPLPKGIAYREELMKYAEDKLRAEVCLRSMELKDRGLYLAANWNDQTASTLVAERLKNMKLPEKMKLTKPTIKDLPGSLAGAYALWEDGQDLRSVYSKATFYRYRNALLKHGIDISVKRPDKPESNVIPMVRYVVAEFSGTGEIPDFAKGTELYADPFTRHRRCA